MATVRPDYAPREEDREFYQRELASFIPDKVFDAHTHVWHPDHNVFAESFPPLVDYENYVRLMEDIYPGRVAKGLFIPTFRDPSEYRRSQPMDRRADRQGPEAAGGTSSSLPRTIPSGCARRSSA